MVQALSKEEVFQANVLGWCIEWVRASSAVNLFRLTHDPHSFCPSVDFVEVKSERDLRPEPLRHANLTPT